MGPRTLVENQWYNESERTRSVKLQNHKKHHNIIIKVVAAIADFGTDHNLGSGLSKGRFELEVETHFVSFFV